MQTYNFTDFNFKRIKKSSTEISIPVHYESVYYNIVEDIFYHKEEECCLIFNMELDPVPDYFKGKRLCIVYNECKIARFDIGEVTFKHNGDYEIITYEQIKKIYRKNKI